MNPPVATRAAALAGLPGMGPRRLARLLARWDVEEAWARVVAGRAVEHDAELAAACGRDPAGLASRWSAEASAADLDEVGRAIARLGLGVHVLGAPGYPQVLADDLEPPPVLFSSGPVHDLAAVARVAVVGTRSATAYGTGVAALLGAELAEAGVAVVSGLAVGIDGAAHRGALAAGGAPVAVVASGHDVVYPRRHAGLWSQVTAQGVLLSEVPPGGRPEAWRFPARNRVVAALARAVVVVESGPRGGSMYTVEEAQRRDRPVLAVPGPVDSPASEGTNGLLAEGALMARDTTDVLLAIGSGGAAAAAARPPRAGHATSGAAPTADPAVISALRGAPRTVGQLAAQLRRPLREVAVEVARLVADGSVSQRGQWLELVRRGRR